MNSFVDTAPPDFLRRVRLALKCWHDIQPKAGLLDDLLLAQEMAAGKSLTRRQSTNLLLDHALDRLDELSPSEADLLRLRFCGALDIQEARLRMHYAASTIYSKQRRAVSRLASVIYGLEMSERKKRASGMEGDLDIAPPLQLIGVDAQIAQLCNVLTKQYGPWLVSIEGMGGLGKTALAGTVMRQLALTSTFAGLGWVSAQAATLDLCGEFHFCRNYTLRSAGIIAQLEREVLNSCSQSASAPADSRLSALRMRLQQAPHLIVIDHAESVIDFAVLLPILHSLANPSKFLLTTRRRLIAERGVYLHAVPELNRADSLKLMRQAAHEQNLLPMLTCNDQDLLAVYEAVGGNPLALLLVVGQTHVRPLHIVLSDLASVRTQPIEALFEFILYRTWTELGDAERRVLTAFPLAKGKGLCAEEIGAKAGLTTTKSVTALQHLIQAGLVYMSSNPGCCLYHLHSLTRTFLKDVAWRWSA